MSTIFTVYDENDQKQTFAFKCPICGHDTVEETWGGYRFLPLEEVILWNDHSSRTTWNEEDSWDRTKERSFSCAHCENTFMEDGEVCESPHELCQILFGVGEREDTDGLVENKEPDTSE